jgi:hypothetical protein
MGKKLPSFGQVRTGREEMQNILHGSLVPWAGRGGDDVEPMSTNLEREDIVEGRKGYVHS